MSPSARLQTRAGPIPSPAAWKGHAQGRTVYKQASADALAPALDQKKKHSGEADSRDYSNHVNVFHVVSPFPAFNVNANL
jgi:hypothetical protein